MYVNAAVVNVLKRLVDVVIVLLAAETATNQYFHKSLPDLSSTYVISVYSVSILTIYILAQFELYSSWRGRIIYVMFSRVSMAWGLALSINLLIVYLFHRSNDLSRMWMTYWFVFGSAGLLFYRFFAYKIIQTFRKNGKNIKRVVLVGYGRSGQEIHKRAVHQAEFGYSVAAICCDAKECNYIPSNSINWIANFKDIPHYVTENRIHEVWLALELKEYGRLEELQFCVLNTLADVRWIPDTPSIRLISRKTEPFLGMLTVDLNSSAMVGIRGLVKELFDKILSLAILIILAIPFAVIAILIKATSPGPVFFKQTRHGLNGKKFTIYKFRTMKVHFENDNVTQAVANDNRFTVIGKQLRRTSIDELPQFFNVLKGDMSIIGPRPHALEHNKFYENKLKIYMLRHRVKPGITGWAQINGLRGETDTIEKMDERVKYDLHYIQHWTLMLDLKIFVISIIRGWTGENVH